MSLEETTGLITDLADVVKNRQQLQHTAIQKTADQLQTLSDTAANLAQNLPSASPSLIQSNGLVCLMFNKFKRSTCELPKNKGFYHRFHKCQACHKWGCKSCNHRPPGQVDCTKSKARPQGQAHVVSTIAASSGQSACCENGPGFSQSDQASPSPDLTTILSSMHNSLQSL